MMTLAPKKSSDYSNKEFFNSEWQSSKFYLRNDTCTWFYPTFSVMPAAKGAWAANKDF